MTTRICSLANEEAAVKGLLPQRNVWIAVLRLTILLGPSYFAAYLTGEMVWVVPTLAGSGAVAASIGSGGLLTRRVD